ncbi:unnamed protein product [Adineta steineri]|uniref:Uncharacterized protein n=1 Tax=Adineta steineri TaxID=433720 RepID=A0A819TCT9_9BILA|nr:unnamed protein product [Adineta steineri]
MIHPSMKSMDIKQDPIDLKKIHILHSDSNNNNNNNTSIKKVKQYSTLEHIPSTSSNNHMINNNYCHSCGEYYDDIISCDICQTTSHLLCANSSLTKDNMLKDSYFCNNCQMKTKIQDNKDKQQKLILPFRFDPKKSLNLNDCKITQKHHSTLDEIKLSTASNDQSSDEIKCPAINNKNVLSTSNSKRKRMDSSSSINPSLFNSDTQLDILHHLFRSCQPEEFHGPSISLNNLTYQKNCFVCRKSSIKQGPSIQCDYCTLTYHLDCLTPSMITLPLSNKKWMCPNHIEPILDHYLIKKKKISINHRVKLSHQYSQIKQNTIVQEFTERKQTKDYLLSNTIDNHRLERIDISQIPKTIENFYSQANTKEKQICEIENNNSKEELYVQTIFPSVESSSVYDSCIWDILQAILDHIINNRNYEFSSIEPLSIENDYHLTNSSVKTEYNTFDTIDILLQALNQPDHISDQCTLDKMTKLNTRMTTVDSNEQKQNPNSFSLSIDLTQFHSSHAALIHLRSQHVIYIEKYVIWFGSSSLNDICLKDFYQSHSCPYISEKHACLYYDQKHNLFELLNYSEYGTIVNNFRYGLDIRINDDRNNQQENDNFKKCYCLTKPLYKSAWDGPAQIEQGTVFQIGCHEFLLYRHIVR